MNKKIIIAIIVVIIAILGIFVIGGILSSLSTSGQVSQSFSDVKHDLSQLEDEKLKLVSCCSIIIGVFSSNKSIILSNSISRALIFEFECLVCLI
jgi:hypothetical protein